MTQSSQAEDVTGTVKVSDSISAKAGGNYSLENTVINNVEAVAMSVSFIKNPIRLQGPCG
jgi:hypothetical protein